MENYILDILVAINFLWNIVFFVSAWIIAKALIDREYISPKYQFGKIVYWFFILWLAIVIFMPSRETLEIFLGIEKICK